MRHVLILGGGLAGLSAAAALGQSGHHVTVLESRHFLGGRATSYPLTAGDSEIVIDNCQHILLKCCVNLLDFYRRMDVSDRIEFFKEFYFIEPDGPISELKAGLLPVPFHFLNSFTSLTFLDRRDKLAVARGLLAIRAERKTRQDLDRITMLEWLEEKKQTTKAIERFWGPVLVSAINEELGRMAALHGFQVIWLGFLARRDSYHMGVPRVPLGDLYALKQWERIPSVEFKFRATVAKIEFEGDRVRSIAEDGEQLEADHYISALPWERLTSLAPDLGPAYEAFEHSPITGIHLWFDRPVTELPHGVLLDRTIQWFFNKQAGRYLQVVVSASRTLAGRHRDEVIDQVVRELGQFLPGVKEARLEKAHVVKEIRATFSARPGLEQMRPVSETRYRNLSLAGDWTRSGWPATMEGAVRSGYLAAEAAARALGKPESYVLPDIA